MRCRRTAADAGVREVATESGLQPAVCSPGAANQYRWIENLVGFVRSNFLQVGSFVDDADLLVQVKRGGALPVREAGTLLLLGRAVNVVFRLSLLAARGIGLRAQECEHQNVALLS